MFCVLESLKYTRDYKKFNARAFLEQRCPGTEFEVTDNRIQTQWRLAMIHKFYKDFHKEWDNSNATFLEFGAGPYLHTLISAAPYVGEIYHSDYSASCQDETLMWMRKDPNAYSWDPYFKYVVNTLEGQDGGDAVVKRQELLRSKFKDSLYLDMKSDKMLPDYSGKFDIIYTGYCIEAVMSSLDEYKPILKRVFDLINPNGFLLMLANIESTMYYVGESKYFCYPLRIEDVMSTLKEVGFTISYAEIVKMKFEKGIAYVSDMKYTSCFVAQKI